MTALTRYLQQTPGCIFTNLLKHYAWCYQNKTQCHVICCILGLILTSDRASLYEFVCVLVACKIHLRNLSLELPFLSDHRFKPISQTWSFGGNEHKVYLKSKTVEIMSNYGQWWFLFFSSYYFKGRNLPPSTFYFLQRFLVHKAKVICFIRKKPLKNIIYSVGPQIFSECSVAETHILEDFI